LACETGEDCIDESSWQIGVAVGLGVRTNPLVDGDAIPLVILPDVAWYGESAYFDNGELGFQWLAQDKFSFETFISLERERAFFSFWQPANIFISSPAFTTDSPGIPSEDNQSPATPPISVDQVANRQWSINAGIRAHYRLQSSEWLVSALSDVSNVHNGSQFSVSYINTWQRQNWKITVIPKLTWKSSALIDYFYGISERDKVNEAYFYEGTSGWQPSIAVVATKKINPQWQWILRAKLQKLHTGMSDSPLVEDNSIRSVFAGVGYQF
jgi:outer membrane protein